MYEFKCDRGKAELEYNGFRFDYMEVEKTVCQDYMDSPQCDERDFETFRKDDIECVLEEMFCDLGYFDIHELHEISPSWFSYLADAWYYESDYEGDYPTESSVIDHYEGISFTTGDFIA